MTDQQKIDKITNDCWDNAVDTFGYAYIFKKNVDRVEPWLRWSKVFGIMIPVLLGGIIGTYSSYPNIISKALIFTGVAGLIQLVISTYLTVVGSDEKLSLYSRLQVEYSILNSEFDILARMPLVDLPEYQKKYEILIEKGRGLSRSTGQVSDKNLRMGMRAGLRQYRRACAGCSMTPVSMQSSDCYVCGHFKFYD